MIERKGFQPFPMAGGKDGRLVYPDALAARPRKPKSLLRWGMDSPNVSEWLTILIGGAS
jgi:hypothetical protein